MNSASKIASISIFAFIAYLVWQTTSAVVVDEQYNFSHSDIDKLYEVEVELGKIIGTSVVESKVDVLYNLVISSIQKSILKKSGVKIEPEKATQFVEQNNQHFKGVYQKFKQQLGGDYYRLLIEPVAVSETFLRFYRTMEPAQRRSSAILKMVQEQGLKDVADKLKQKIVDINIDKNNIALVQEFSKFKKKDKSSIIYPKTLKIGNNIVILDLNFNKGDIGAKALTFKIVPYRDFLTQLAKKINIEFSMFSRYNLKDIFNKKGSVL